jgi:tetratricopeptide (TPR) repeat protein
MRATTLNRRRRSFALASLLALPAASLVVASAAQAQETPSEILSQAPDSEPPEGENPVQAARMQLLAGQRELRRGEKLADRARAATDEEERSETEAKSRAAFEAAVAAFVESVRLQPQHVEAYLGLGDALTRLGRHDQAVQVHITALSRFPKDLDNLRGLARSMLVVDRLGETTQIHERLHGTFPEGAAVVMEELKAWLERRRAAPADIRPEDIERLATWIAEREEKAG